MKATFKPLALVAAVAAVTAGSAGIANAQTTAAGAYPSMGDFAIVPYYTVQGEWVTGVHVTNTSSDTQVIKVRVRRAEDSDDVLDFNLILSPYDVWTGTIRGDDSAMEFVTVDKSCSAPLELQASGVAPVQVIDGAQEGYIEVIGMASVPLGSPLGLASKHVAGTPVDCLAVTTNFFSAAQDPVAQTSQQVSSSIDPLLTGTNTYGDTDNVLKVSYFIRDNASGIEFGNNAVHIQDFANQPMLTHQEYGLESFLQLGATALDGWDFPDVTGGGASSGYRTAFQDVVRPTLGANELINDWSYNATTGAATDWVVTLPGQYSMIDIYAIPTVSDTIDYREMPVVATFTVLDREEGEGVPGGLGFSPSPAPDAAILDYEVNVITWGPEGAVPPVLDAANALRVDPAAAGIDRPTGWAALNVVGTPKLSRALLNPQPVPFSVCDHASGAVGNCVDVSGTPVPMVGFTAWQRTFADPDKNYGRLVEHSFSLSP